MEQRLALLFALGGAFCLFLAAGSSMTEGTARRSQQAVQHVAFEAVQQRALKRATHIAAQIQPALQAGDQARMRAQLELMAQGSPDVIEMGVMDPADHLNIMACSDPGRVGRPATGLPLLATREPIGPEDSQVAEDFSAQQLAVVVPIGRKQVLARLYVQETAAAFEDDLSRVVVLSPPRVPVWLTILLGVLGLGAGAMLLYAGARKQVLRVQEAVEQMVMGAFDTRLDPLEVPQLMDLADRLNAMAEQVQLLQQAQLEGTIHATRINEELQNAQVVQQTLMPDVRRIARGPLQLCGVYRSVSRLSGDWWHYYPLDDHRTLLVLADVLGHGIGAAVVGAMAYGCAAQLHQEMQGELRPDVLLQRLNRAIWTTTKGKYTMSCFAAILDTRACLLTYASGAHAFPLLFRARDQQKPFVPLVAPGAPLGSSEDPEFTASTQPFEQGDLLVCYTDGLIEAANGTGDAFGDKRVRQTVQRAQGRNVEEICEILLSEVSRFVGSAELEDDQTLVVARNLPSAPVSWSNP